MPRLGGGAGAARRHAPPGEPDAGRETRSAEGASIPGDTAARDRAIASTQPWKSGRVEDQAKVLRRARKRKELVLPMARTLRTIAQSDGFRNAVLAGV